MSKTVKIKTRPFLRWAGGKQKIINKLLENAPNHENINKYYEPFLGAGSLFFSNGFDNGVISDVNNELVNSYRQIKDNHLELYNYLKEFNNKFNGNKEYYYELRKEFNENRDSNTILQASRFIFLIHSNYNGMYRINKKGEYNVPLGRLNPNLPDLRHLTSVSEKLKSVEIGCFGYKNIIHSVSERDFIYLDPPYPPYDWAKYQNQYTTDKFSKEDHEELAVFADELKSKDCYVMISYPDVDFIRDIYSENWSITELDTFRSISCKKERKKISELIIKNY